MINFLVLAVPQAMQVHPQHPHLHQVNFYLHYLPLHLFILSVQNDSLSHCPLLFIELPGFYFDPEKNRYFRLLPGHNNCNPLTKEGLHKKEEENKRSALLAEDDGPRKVSWGITEYIL